MRIARLAVLLLVLLALPAMSPVWANGKDKHVKVREYEEGHAFCPPRAVVIGAIIVPAGQCYQLAVLRDNRGAFLAFVDPRVRIHSGEVERLDSSDGRKLRRHILFLAPIQSVGQIALVPVNTIQLVRLREEDEEDEDEDEVRVNRSKLIVVLPNAPVVVPAPAPSSTPNVSIVLVVTF